MIPTQLFEQETERHLEGDLKPREGWSHSLQDRADRLRYWGRETNPFWPGISCAQCEEKMALESSFWCEDCREPKV